MAARIDISSELNVIAIEPYGDAVKTAVHDAIQKVNSGSGGSKNDGPKLIDRWSNGVVNNFKGECVVLHANSVLDISVPDVIAEET